MNAADAWRTVRCRVAALCLGMAVLPFAAAATAQTAGQTITAIIDAGSVGNSATVLVANANSWATLRVVRFSVADGTRYVSNLRFDPPRIDELAPNASREVTVTFDVTADVPDEGARETVVVEVAAAEGILDQSRLTLNLGIQTDESSLNIVPFVVGMKTDEAVREVGKRGLEATTEEASLPADSALFGTVAAQGTPAGEIVPAGTRIALTVFPKAPIIVPEVAGLKVEEATRLVADAGLEPEVIPLGDAPSEEAANVVERADPPAGTPVGSSAVVALFAYGSFRPPPEEEEGEEEPPVATVAGDWGQPWRGELKLTLLVADGQAMSVLEALRRYASQGEPEPEPEESEEEVGILAAPGAVAGEVGRAIGEGIGEGLGEAMVTMASGIAGMLEAGAPLSFTLVKEQGGFRLRIPGSTPFIEQMNKMVAIVPLLLPEGDRLLRATMSTDTPESTFALTTEITASPDWSELTVRISLKGTQADAPRSLELVLTGTARQGLFEAADYESAVMKGFSAAVQKYAAAVGIEAPDLNLE